MSEAYLHGFNLIVEAVRQVRGTSTNQVDDVELLARHVGRGRSDRRAAVQGRPMIDGMLLPQPDDDSAPFFEFAAAGELRIQRCASCGRRRMPPQPMCPACGSFEVEWERMSGRGRVWSVVVVHPPLLPAYAAQAPYNVVVVELDDDPSIRLVGNVVDVGRRATRLGRPALDRASATESRWSSRHRSPTTRARSCSPAGGVD